MLVSTKIESAAIVTIKILTAQREVAGPRPNIVRRQIQRLTRCSSRGVVFNDNHRGMFTGGNSTQVHYTVKVPASAEVRFTTVNGGIELTGLSGRITAEATNGGIKARDVSGAIDASTTNGGVEVELARMPESGVKLECTNGGIELKLPSSARATISARITNGGINTDGVQISQTGESSRRRLEGTMNGGGPRIDIEGTNGGIRISGR